MNSHMLTHESGKTPGVWLLSFGFPGKGRKQMGLGGKAVGRNPGIGFPFLPANGCHVRPADVVAVPFQRMNSFGGNALRKPPLRCNPPAAYPSAGVSSLMADASGRVA